MVADDHAIDSLKVWFEIEYGELKKEWQSSKYEKLSNLFYARFYTNLKAIHTRKTLINQSCIKSCINDNFRHAETP